MKRALSQGEIWQVLSQLGAQTKGTDQRGVQRHNATKTVFLPKMLTQA